MTAPCEQIESIQYLKANQTLFMEILKEVKEDVKDIKKYLFEGGLEEHYAKRESVKRLWTIVWSIISFFAVAIGAIIIAGMKYFLSLGIE